MLSQFNNPIKIVKTIKNNKLNAKISLRKEKLEDLINAKRFKNLNEAKVFDFITFYSSLNIAEEELNFIKQIDSETPDINQINDYIKFAKGNNISNTNISPDKATQNNSPNHRSKINMINEVKNVSPVPGNEEDLLSLLARVDDYQKIISSEIEVIILIIYK